MDKMISIIVPIYNVEKYLDKCLESIINQTYKNLEIILVNDGTPDRSREICKKYIDIDNRIILIDKENGGLSSARNKGLDIAKGDYIAFIDSDDWVESNMYEVMIGIANKEDADIVQCGFKSIFENNNVKRIYRYKNEIICGKYKIIDAYFKDHKINTVVWNKLYKRELFNNIRMIEGRNNEDTMLMPELLLQSQKVVNIDSIYYNYLQRPNTIMSSKFNEKKLDHIYASNYVINLCKLQIEDYINYAYINHCLNSILLYRSLKKDMCDNEKQYEDFIVNEFKSAYKYIRSSEELNKSNKSIKYLIKLFSINKVLCNYILNIRENIKMRINHG